MPDSNFPLDPKSLKNAFKEAQTYFKDNPDAVKMKRNSGFLFSKVKSNSFIRDEAGKIYMLALSLFKSKDSEKNKAYLGWGSFAYVKWAMDIDSNLYAVRIERKSMPMLSTIVMKALQVTDLLVGIAYRETSSKNNTGESKVIAGENYKEYQIQQSGQSLFDFLLEKKQDLNLDDRMKIAARIAIVLSKFHALNIAHGDIKPENIIINPKTLDVHLIDCDFARALDKQVSRGNGLAGTATYMPFLDNALVTLRQLDIEAFIKTLFLPVGDHIFIGMYDGYLNLSEKGVSSVSVFGYCCEIVPMLNEALYDGPFRQSRGSINCDAKSFSCVEDVMISIVSKIYRLDDNRCNMIKSFSVFQKRGFLKKYNDLLSYIDCKNSTAIFLLSDYVTLFVDEVFKEQSLFQGLQQDPGLLSEKTSLEQRVSLPERLFNEITPIFESCKTSKLVALYLSVFIDSGGNHFMKLLVLRTFLLMEHDNAIKQKIQKIASEDNELNLVEYIGGLLRDCIRGYIAKSGMQASLFALKACVRVLDFAVLPAMHDILHTQLTKNNEVLPCSFFSPAVDFQCYLSTLHLQCNGPFLADFQPS